MYHRTFILDLQMLKVAVAEEFEIFLNVLLIHTYGLFIANKVIDRRNHNCINIYFNYRNVVTS